LAVYVPAHPCLWSQLDEAVGHVRRYRRAELRDKLAAAGLEVLTLYYADSIGFFAAFYLRLRGYERGRGVAGDGPMRFYDRVCYPVSRVLDALGARRLWGKNLFAIARKPAQ
jgi:hypothetical protein